MLFPRRKLTEAAIRFILAGLITACIAIQITPLNPFRSISAVAQATSDPAIEGWIEDALTLGSVAGAQITLNDSLQSTANSEGYFSFSTSQLAAAGIMASERGEPVRLQVLASGHAPWSISNALYYAGNTLRLYPRLASEDSAPTIHVARYNLAASPARKMAERFSISQPDTNFSVLREQINSMQIAGSIQSAGAAGVALPATVRVYRSGSGTVEVVPFREYLKHVLPCEWIPTWSMESLKAGAMAVKSYAWFWVSRGGKQTGLGADVKDNTEDQVYDPNISYASTDAAVDATYQYSMTMYGSLFQAQYCAGSYVADPRGDCPWPAPYMTQWGSSYHSDRGRSWGWILQFYYPGVVISPSPPGGGSDAPRATVAPPVPPVPPAATKPLPTTARVPPAEYAIGQGAANPQVYADAYARNGGQQALGKPTGPVRWWLTYVSENNVQTQPLSGPDGKGNTWLVYDVLKSDTLGIRAAYVLSGSLATAYAMHNPPGPEWVGAPTCDAYSAAPEAGSALSQGFAKGNITVSGNTTQFNPWPQSFSNWKGEWFVGRASADPANAPAFELAGQPALVREVSAPDMQWDGQVSKAGAYGVGKADWSAQFTRDYQTGAGAYDFTLAANSDARLWVDGMLAINGRQWSAPSQATYSVDFTAGPHRIRVQYSSPNSSAQLSFKMEPRAVVQSPPPPPAATIAPQGIGKGEGTAQLRVRVGWLGRAAAPNDSWAQPLTLQLSIPGSAAIVGAYPGATDRNGVAFYSALPAGIYDVHVKGPHSLQSARAGISLTGQSVIDVDMKMQVEGDIDGDNCVTIDDYTLVQAQLGMSRGMPDYRPSADLNNDGEVNLADVSLLRSGFDKCGDISADTEFTTMSADNAPTLAQSLSPWLAPELLQHNLGMAVVPLVANAQVGQIVDAQVVADTGSQAIDGGAFVLKYDPTVLLPVDFDGNPASGALPALALPSVMGNWVDAKGGLLGYSAGMLQGQSPQGRVVIAKLRFKVLTAPQTGHTTLSFVPTPSGAMQLTNGGVNLLGKATDAGLTIAP